MYVVCLKSSVNGTRKQTKRKIQINVTAVLRSIPKEDFDDSFQKLYERFQQLCCEGWRLF
jgi:hypothetical protein